MTEALLLFLLALGGGVQEGTVLGAWVGRWTTASSAQQGGIELLVSKGERDGTLLGQVTFLQDGLARTARLEGRLAQGTLRFDLPDGAIVLRPQGGRLVGEFRDGALAPAGQGLIELSPRAP